VRVQLSWTKLLSAPIVVELDGLDVVAVLKTSVEHRERINIDLRALNTAIESATAEAAEGASSGEASDTAASGAGAAESKAANDAVTANSAPSWTERLVMRLIDVLRVRVTNVHIRVESVGTGAVRPAHPFSLGVRLQELHVLSLDENSEATDSVSADQSSGSTGDGLGFIRKRATISGLAVCVARLEWLGCQCHRTRNDCGGLPGT